MPPPLPKTESQIARELEIQALIEKQKNFKLTSIEEDFGEVPKEEKKSQKSKRPAAVAEIFAGIDADYDYADEEDYERLEKIRYTNPTTG